MLFKEDLYQNLAWPGWLEEIKQAPHTTVFLHGIMGSELYDTVNEDTVWIDSGIWHEVDDLEVAKLTPNGLLDSENQMIYARTTVKPPIVKRPYAEILDQLKVGRFNYDWRESIPIEASRLEKFLDWLLAQKDDITFVTHSMGGCVLFWLLASTTRFDSKIRNIIFCAPPFHGALKPMRVVEDGNGTPADLLINNSTLQHSAATMPGLFDLLVAPSECWISTLPSPGGPINLQHPIRSNYDIYLPSSWTNCYRPDMLRAILEFSRDYHRRRFLGIKNVVARLADRINVIVGLNGKTDFAAVWRQDLFHWSLHSPKKPTGGKVSNGDGTVLFQSTFLPGLDTGRYWAHIPKYQQDTHGGLVDIQEVIYGIDALLAGAKPSTLTPYPDFIEKIDWSLEEVGIAPPAQDEMLDYHERARMRQKVPYAQWGHELNPNDDALLFSMTRDAAIRVVQGGESLDTAAAKIGQSAEFLEQHIKSLLMPVLFG